MGATCLVHWKDANGPQSVTLLTDRLHKQFHATHIGRWNISWKVFRDISPVSKSGTGKMMHIVHVQGGASARGVPPGSLSANSTAVASAAAANVVAGTGPVGGPGASSGPSGGVGSTGSPAVGIGSGIGSVSGPGTAGVGGGAVAGAGGSGKSGLGILPSAVGGVGAGSGGPGNAGPGAGGSGQPQADAYNTTAWCLIDEGAVGIPTTATMTSSSAASSVTNTSLGGSAPGGGGSADQTMKRKAVLVEVEKDIEALIAKLKNLWVHRQHAQVDGQVYDLGDFVVRVGNIMVGSTSYKGVLIEIEYLPQTSSATISNAILEEFVRLISPPGVNLYSPNMLEYPYDQVGLDPGSWSMLHSGFQYMTLFRRQHIL
ncbi:hypothetical protein BGZ83_008705 [Gryganskiella cystojenkinii]|nr:hypothetical protein BGZ83_008705 [Gryganskiella cystojenkinii]